MYFHQNNTPVFCLRTFIITHAQKYVVPKACFLICFHSFGFRLFSRCWNLAAGFSPIQTQKVSVRSNTDVGKIRSCSEFEPHLIQSRGQSSVQANQAQEHTAVSKYLQADHKVSVLNVFSTFILKEFSHRHQIWKCYYSYVCHVGKAP